MVEILGVFRVDKKKGRVFDFLEETLSVPDFSLNYKKDDHFAVRNHRYSSQWAD